tara:strand:+ start:12860 stop:13459 length:600 start_codon:yes stop_codon:yes gene_type:complete
MFYPVLSSKIPRYAAFLFTLASLLSAVCFSLIIQTSKAQASEQNSGKLTKVYKVLGADGSVSFSDQANETSETIMVAPIPTVPAIDPGKIKSTSQPPSDEVYSRYSSLSILAPANDSAFYSGSGDVDILLEIKPALLEGDQIQLFLDGKLIKSDNQIQTTLKTVDRGTHELRVQLVSASGKVQKEATSSFTVHRPSIRN